MLLLNNYGCERMAESLIGNYGRGLPGLIVVANGINCCPVRSRLDPPGVTITESDIASSLVIVQRTHLIGNSTMAVTVQENPHPAGTGLSSLVCRVISPVVVVSVALDKILGLFMPIGIL